jgi:large subunit ribosomal protein L1
VVCEESKIDEAKNANADLVGGDDLVEKIKNGDLNFEKLICTPSMMIKLSKLGKVLGPKGLMPNPKLGTVTNDISKLSRKQKLVKLKFEMTKMEI